jgi:hypothetical protein
LLALQTPQRAVLRRTPDTPSGTSRRCNRNGYTLSILSEWGDCSPLLGFIYSHISHASCGVTFRSFWMRTMHCPCERVALSFSATQHPHTPMMPPTVRANRYIPTRSANDICFPFVEWLACVMS